MIDMFLRSAELVGRRLKIPADGNKDRYGFSHCAGYRRDDYWQCPNCEPPPGVPFAECRLCGGYGEISKSSANVGAV